MSLDINTKKLTKNAYRVTKNRNYTALRVRVPGGAINAEMLSIVSEIAEKFGDGSVHITTRQGFQINMIPLDKVDEVNKYAKKLIIGLEINAVHPENGYPAAGTRNVSGCVGNRECPIAQFNTTDVVKRIEKIIFPNDFHFKIAVTGCPNDCIKAHSQDFGIIGQADVEYEYSRCIGCNACSKRCKKVSTEALTPKNGKIIRDSRRCIGCGECVLACPTSAWTRNPNKKYKLVIMGRTGKINPRVAMPFIEWTTEKIITKIILKTYEFVDKYIDRTLPKEHIGYIVDRVGFKEFKNFILEGIEMNDGAKISESINFGGYFNDKDRIFKTY